MNDLWFCVFTDQKAPLSLSMFGGASRSYTPVTTTSPWRAYRSQVTGYRPSTSGTVAHNQQTKHGGWSEENREMTVIPDDELPPSP